jgi:hypothetical protein
VTSQTIAITVNGDTTVEPTETFTVNLGIVTSATVADGTGTGTGTIVNDDSIVPLPSISIGDATVTEGNSGTKTMTFTVSLSSAPTSTVTAGYATADGTATAAGGDYVAVTSGNVTFAPGVTSQTIAITVNGDTTVEPTETFTVNLGIVTGATVADGTGTGTIVNDD